jgi:hypothetical protein
MIPFELCDPLQSSPMVYFDPACFSTATSISAKLFWTYLSTLASTIHLSLAHPVVLESRHEPSHPITESEARAGHELRTSSFPLQHRGLASGVWAPDHWLHCVERNMGILKTIVPLTVALVASVLVALELRKAAKKTSGARADAPVDAAPPAAARQREQKKKTKGDTSSADASGSAKPVSGETAVEAATAEPALAATISEID